MHLIVLKAAKWREFACFDLSAGLGFEKRCHDKWRNRR
jgi:hypothetical protein